jgi:hypothetical protein
MIEKTFTVGANRAKMTLSDDGRFRVAWSPHLPGALSPSDWAHYMSGRNALVQEMSESLVKNDCILRPYDKALWIEATP